MKVNSSPAAEKILVVDDDPTALLFASSTIGKAGYTVYKAATGNEALSHIKQHQPDLVLLDVMLPDINGLEICRTIKKDKLLKHIFVLLFSALQTDSQDKALGLETGADGYLVKPVHQRELIAQIQAMLRLKRAEEKVSRQKNWYETVLNSLQEVVVCVDSDLNLIWGNKSAMDSINTPLKSAMGQKCYDLWGCRNEFLNDCPVVRSMKSGQIEHGLVKADDGTTWDTRAYPVRNEQGHVINMLEVAMDVTQNIETRRALEQNEELLQEVTSRMPGAVIQYMVNNHQKVHLAYVSQGIYNLLGISPETVRKSPQILWSRIHHSDLEHIHSQFTKSTVRNRAFGSDFRVFGPDNVPKWVRLSTVPYKRDETMAWYAILTDITPLKIVEQELTRKALHDPLTGLPNRELFNDRLDLAVSYAQRYQQKVGLIFIDLNGFKPVNDRFGHMFGDSVLQTVARRLSKCARKTDTVARFGGDEFVIILSSLNDRNDVERILKKIRDIMPMNFEVNGQPCVIGASMGISIYPDDARTTLGLIEAADKAMYCAKKNPSQEYLFFKDLEEFTQGGA